MRMLKSKTLYILIPNPQGNLAPRQEIAFFCKVEANSGSWQPNNRVNGKKNCIFEGNFPVKG